MFAAACLAVGILVVSAASAGAVEAEHWRWEPAQVPPAPAGVTTAYEYGVPLGVVGEISFWAPNRGLLITGGTEENGGPVASGLYAYDGRSWHQLATVCGGAEGRIVWAGPEEFWTIADQRSGQIVSTTRVGEFEAPAVSLCHFVGAEVVGSYAMPLEEPDSWQKMDSGACYSPNDCWFGGEDGSAPNVGAFHLHWNGSTVTAVYEPEDHAVTSMVGFQGKVYEAVELSSSDARVAGEANPPAVIHTIAPAGVEPIFGNLAMVSQATKKLLPEYGKEVLSEALKGLDLAVDAPAGSAATQLWAAASPWASPPGGSKPAALTVLHDGAAGWSQVVPGPSGQTPLGGAVSLSGTSDEIAPEPGSEDAWLSLRGGGRGAEVALLEADGTLAQTDLLPEVGEEVGYSGRSGPIACPAAHDCWMATFGEPASDSGSLFHLSDGVPEEPDNNPVFDGADGVITYRPPDSGIPGTYAEVFVPDDSLANQQVIKEQPKPKRAVKLPKPKAKRLVKGIKSELLRHRTLVIAFTLTAKAHVQLVARANKQTVARTPRELLRPGKHRISLTLNSQHWPTKLQFEAKPIGGRGASSSSEGDSGEGDVVGT